MKLGTARLFRLERDIDSSGVSGTGIVAEGTLYSNGKVTITWLTTTSSVAVYDCFEAAIAVHGHGGNTRFVFVE